jgi:hypothetical protein
MRRLHAPVPISHACIAIRFKEIAAASTIPDHVQRLFLGTAHNFERNADIKIQYRTATRLTYYVVENEAFIEECVTQTEYVDTAQDQSTIGDNTLADFGEPIESIQYYNHHQARNYFSNSLLSPWTKMRRAEARFVPNLQHVGHGNTHGFGRYERIRSNHEDAPSERNGIYPWTVAAWHFDFEGVENVYKRIGGNPFSTPPQEGC